VITVSEEQRVEVEGVLRRRDLSPRQRERLEMVKAIGLGQEVGEVARWSGRTPRTVRQWVGRFTRSGVDAVCDAPRSGRPARADAAYQEALESALRTPPPMLGLPFDVWTSARLSAYLAEMIGVRIAPSWLRSLLGRREYVYGRPKHTLHHLQNRTLTAACADLLAAVEKKGGTGA
jgi:transposase